MQGHHVIEISDPKEARRLLEKIGASKYGVEYMSSKAVFRCLKLKNIPARMANIIKQEMLSKGGEAAVGVQAATLEGTSDVLLMGTINQYERLNEKLKRQPFGLAALAVEIETLLSGWNDYPQRMQLAHGKTLDFGKRTLIMGILNVTPDSFSDGGRYVDTQDAIRHALQMYEEGADLIDIGGASSRPNSVMAEEQVELARVLPVVEALAGRGILLSVDTFRAKVAEQALERGAHLINDISSLQLDNGLLPVLIRQDAPVILMHNRMQIHKNIPYTDLISDIIIDLNRSIDGAIKKGLPQQKILIDPGIGFGKTPAENRLILKHLHSFKQSGYPLVLGTSRKSFMGQTLDLEVEERLEASLATAVIGILNGADMVRVHDVKETKRVAMMTDAVRLENG